MYFSAVLILVPVLTLYLLAAIQQGDQIRTYCDTMYNPLTSSAIALKLEVKHVFNYLTRLSC